MGNTNSQVTSGVKKQADSKSQPTYGLANLQGGGQLVELMKEALKTRNYAELDDKIRELVEPFLYNGGRGKLIPVTEFVLLRNKDRPKHKQLTPPKPDPASNSNSFEVEDANLATVNGSANMLRKESCKYRDVCWDLYDRGSVGETALHLCLLVATSVHAELAKRLIKLYPKLVNEIYTSDEYYGENVLHMAIVNEDPAMVKFLLDNGADYHERCIGNFFCAEDQKASRSDSLDHEWVDLCVKTNYEGYVYWGEYPLSIAACVGQEECYRLLLAKGADPNKQDTNGNTAIHMLVVCDKINMFNMVYELGGVIDLVNRQGLTPLTLAAKLARKEMFFHIQKVQREIYWQLGSITCFAYPLEEVDTISSQTGDINKVSSLNLVVYGENSGHLDMMEGLLVDLLNAKWNTFIKFRFYRQFAVFFVYFLLSSGCFVLRPGPIDSAVQNSTNYSSSMNSTSFGNFSNFTNQSERASSSHCYLLDNDTPKETIRMVLECLTVIGAFCYLFNTGREARFLGYNTFVENLMTVPSRVLFLISCNLVMLMIPLRFACLSTWEDIAAVFVMLTTAPYYLFFCRGFKMVGPFVVMIYKMILTDLLCFVTIYLVFVLGFSQAFYVIFLSHNGEADKNFFPDPIQSVMAMFVMSLSEFGDIYEEFDNTDHPTVAKMLFIVYMALVTILLINMLIAMMGKTYQDIAERRNEWMRQWARIVLVVERGVSPSECLKQQMRYSQAMSDGRRALVLRLQQTDTEMEELRALENLKSSHRDNVRRQMAGSNILSPRSTPRKTISTTSL